MRHLSVPSKQTASWRERLATKGWLAEGYAIQSLADLKCKITHININPEGGVPKHPVESAFISSNGIKGDKQQDMKHHGGLERAVSIYSSELILQLQQENHPIFPGSTGENLTLSGVNWHRLAPGTILQSETTILEITAPATPCKTISNSFKDGKFTRISEKTNPGWSRWYARVIMEGAISCGDTITLQENRRAIPLNENAPLVIENTPIIDLPPISPGPKHWTERLDPDLYLQYQQLWPMSYDQVGDVIIFKLPDELTNFSEEIANAMLQQYQNARVICADYGVKGEFRVRDLKPIISRDENMSTKTQVKEHGNTFWVDPSVGYFSPRLATERLATLETATILKQELNRSLTICDPYAGFGPAIVPLISHEGLVKEIIASDLNPDAVAILRENLPIDAKINCCDARDLKSKYSEKVDLLLVNLPHDSLAHLPELLPLMAKNHPVVVRCWAIIPLDKIEQTELELKHIFAKSKIHNLKLEPARSYSPNESYTCIEAKITFIN